MVTATYKSTADLEGDFEFKGLSTDQKPTETFEGVNINNGSSFFEIDTQVVKFYNEASDTWI